MWPDDAAGRAAITRVLGCTPRRLVRLAGGCVAEVFRVELDAEWLVAKVDDPRTGQLHIEGAMLHDLAPHLPVPAVRHAEPGLLLLEWVEGASRFGEAAEEHAAALLASLHRVTAPRFGYGYDTLIGGLAQPNPQSERWLPFFAEHRLLEMAAQARAAGHLGAADHRRVERLAGRLDRWLTEPAQPALLHGDVWSGNVLASGDRIRAFLDPAIYFGHPEVELAFIAMFATFGPRFFDAYGIEAGFHEQRCPLYNLYPYLVHLRLFGGSYLGAVRSTLERFGV